MKINISPEDKKAFISAAETWGEFSQIGMIMEECGELLTAINKRRRGLNTPDDVLSEVADVMIMCLQLCQMLDVNMLELESVINEKLSRLRILLENDLSRKGKPAEESRTVKDCEERESISNMVDGMTDEQVAKVFEDSLTTEQLSNPKQLPGLDRDQAEIVACCLPLTLKRRPGFNRDHETNPDMNDLLQQIKDPGAGSDD